MSGSWKENLDGPEETEEGSQQEEPRAKGRRRGARGTCMSISKEGDESEGGRCVSTRSPLQMRKSRRREGGLAAVGE